MIRRAVPVVLAATLLAACSSTPRSAFYTLSSGGIEPPRAKADASLAIGIGPVSIPELVDRPQIVVRTAANTVGIEEFNRWAEPLKSEIPRVVAAGVARRVPEAYVAVFPFSDGLNPDLRVTLDVQAFESDPGASVTIAVHWSVTDRAGRVVAKGQSVERESAEGGYDALASAHGRALDRVAGDIAAAILAAPRTPR